MIENVEITGGSLISPPEALATDSWLESWRLEGLELAGSYRPEMLALDLNGGRLVAHRRDAAPFLAELAGRLRGPPPGRSRSGR